MTNSVNMSKSAQTTAARDTDQSANSRFPDPIARVVAAFAARESATVEVVVALAQQLSGAFAQPAQQSRPVPVARPEPVLATSDGEAKPALNPKDAVTDELVYCLCCGKGFTMLKRHLKAEHNLTEEQYRAMYSLPEDFPLVAPNYSARKAAYAKKVGLGKYARDPQAPNEEHPVR
jgi:predicted transcriptional regulator